MRCFCKARCRQRHALLPPPAGLLAALAIAIHNMPEGLAAFIGTVADPKAGAAIAFAIAMHNIPEGIVVW